jgi:serine/threonine-protein kinase
VAPDRVGRYEIQRRLGTGGMGSLYLARDPGLDRLVAIKLLREECRDDPELRERFIREARSVARLRHPNIVIVYDVGEDDGRPFMAMEYIAGETLTKILRRTPSVPITERLSLFEALCAGLAHAHGAGIIHRDIKPANIMLDSDRVLKILDFGIARLGNSGITQDGMMMGTINYMSPEQVVGRGVDHRTDIFAAGAVLYEMIALEQAFPGGIDAGVLHRILNEGPAPLEERAPGIDPELAGIVRRALERDPTRRYQDANGMRLDVVRVRRRLTEEAVADGASKQTTTVIGPSRQRPSGTGRKADSDRPGRLSPERLAQLRQQQVEEHLRYSEEAFARGDHDAALHHAERAATADPDSRAAIDLIERARFAIEAKAIRQLLGEAQRLLMDGHLDDAAALADEASVTLPDIEGSADLRREVRQAVEKIATARERERRINDSLQRAKESLERGGYETALRAVYEVLALDPERPDARRLEQTAKERLQAQREHEQARRTASDRLEQARALAGTGRFDEALEAIQAVTPPSDTVRVAVADALAAVRKLQRQAAHAAIVADARHALEKGRIDEALAALDTIPPDERSEDAHSVRSAAEDVLRQRRERERKVQALDAAIGIVHQLIGAGDLAKAFERLEAAAQLGVDDERIPALRQHIADLGVAAQQKRQQEARDRLAAKRIEAARQLLADGNGNAAIALLERSRAEHPRIDEALREIRIAVAEQEERVRQEAERKRKEEETRRRAEIEAARKLEEQRKAEEQRRRDEEGRRIRAAELQRRLDSATALLVKAERALEADRPEEAIQSLDTVSGEIDVLQNEALRSRAAAARAEAARRQKRRQEIDAHVSRARERMSQGDLEGVRKAARAALEMEAQNAAALQVLADADAEAKRREAEAKRQEEARKQEELGALEQRKAAEEERRLAESRRLEETRKREEEERRLAEEARKREAAVADLIRRANEVREHAAALTLLLQAESIAPGDTRVQTLQSQRRAALDAQRAAEKAAKKAAQRERELERVRQQIEGHVIRARELLSRSDLVAAKQAAEAALALDANHHDAQRVLADVADEERRRSEEARARQATVVQLVDQAQHAPDHDAALTLLRQAETLVPADPRVRTLIVERRAALDAQQTAERAAQEVARRDRERREQEQRDAAAAAVIANARETFAQGRHDDALALLRGSPPHTSVSNVIAELDARHVQIEQEQATEARRRLRQARWIRITAATKEAISDRRVHASAAVILFAALAWGAVQFWPTEEQQAYREPVREEPPTPLDPQPSPDPNPPEPPVPNPPEPPRPNRPEPPRPNRPEPPRPNRPELEGPNRPEPPVKPDPPPPEKPNPPRPRPEEPGPLDPGPGPTPPSKPVPPVETPPPGPPPVNIAAEQAAIRQLLDQWVAAYNRMDEAALKTIDRGFDGIRSRPLLRAVDLTVSSVAINVMPDGQSAVLQATQTFRYQWNRAGFPPTTTGTLTWRLQKQGTTWAVVP